MVSDSEAHRFAPGIEAWTRNLGRVRDVVRQQLVGRQLAAHLPPGPLEVLDAGCGQGTQALILARAGHAVVGIDVSGRMLERARAAAAAEPADVRARVHFESGDLLDIAGSYDVVCCHGVAMYLPTLDGVVRALLRASRPGGLISLLTRNRFGIAMRAGLARDWDRALAGFEARHYTNRLGVRDVRADEPAEVRGSLVAAGATPLAWYGVRVFCDHWDATESPDDLAGLLAAEEEAGRRDPYRSVAALTHTLARAQLVPAAD